MTDYGYQGRGTGIVVSADGRTKDYPEYDPRSGDHFWMAVSTFHLVDPSDPRQQLDTENLIDIHVGCFFCEQAYEPRLLKRRCPGEPK